MFININFIGSLSLKYNNVLLETIGKKLNALKNEK